MPIKKAAPAKAKGHAEEDATFWYVKVPAGLLADAEKKRETAKASKTGTVVRMLKWYLQEDVDA